MVYQYQYAMYSFQTADRAAAAHEGMNAMAADGWHAHTASASFTDVGILWEREVPPAKRGKAPEDE